MSNPYFAVVADDPVPFITETFEHFGAFDRVYDKKFGQEVPTVKAMSAVLGAATSVVNALSDSDDSFSVRFSPTTESAASGEVITAGGTERVVIIGVRHWLDESLTNAQRACITIALAFHEVGHVRWSQGWHDRLKKSYPDTYQWAVKALNLSHDIMLEFLMPKDYPGFKDTLEPKNRYFTGDWEPTLDTTEDRYTVGMLRLKFPWGLKALDELPLAEWDALGERMRSTKALSTRTQNLIVKDILDLIDPLDEQEGGDGDGGEPDPEGEDTDESESKPSKPGEDDESEDKSEPKVEDADPEGEHVEDEGQEGDGDDGDDSDDRFGEPMDESDDDPDEADGEPIEDDEGGDAESDRPSLHPKPQAEDEEWQSDVDDFNSAQAKGRDLVLTGGGAFHKRELRIQRL